MIDLVLLQPPDTRSANPTMYFPLSLTYLAAVAEKAGYSVEVMDFRKAVGYLPDARFYGFSCTTPQIVQAKEMVKSLKGRGQTIVGGAHATLLPNDCVKHFDYVVVGEGETVLLDIIAGKISKGVVRADRIKNLDIIPYPAWNKVPHPFSDALFAGERYGTGELAATIIGSRGCAWRCHFCGNLFNVPVKFRSAENIVGELKELIKLGVRYFRFEDDNFTIHPDFDNLCAKIGELDVHYKCHTRSQLLTPVIAKLMYDSGCEECGLGVESFDNAVLLKNGKRETAEDHVRAIKILQEMGIRAKTYLMAGLPGETDETVEINKRYIAQCKPAKWTLSTFSPYPGCAIFNNPGLFGVEIINFDWSKWWNFIDYKDGFNHQLIGQTRRQMWQRYDELYDWLRNYDEVNK